MPSNRPRRLRPLVAVVGGLLAVAPMAVGYAVTPSAPRGETVFSFQDPEILEASALVLQDGLFLTTNDSGDTGRVFAVDRSGATVGVTHWSEDPTDTEALAPGGPGHVWVGDIGDNRASRPSVTVTRIPVGRGEQTAHATSYRLTYPRGPRDAETLLRDPVTGRLYVADKNVFGGTLYAAPRHLSATDDNRLRPVGHVLSLATDGAFFPDGRHLVVRNYLSAAVYDWPSLHRLGTFALPPQRQGEGIAVGPDDTLYLSSEGSRAPVVATRVPPALRAAMAAGPSSSAGSTSSPSSTPASPATLPDEASTTASESSSQTWMYVAAGLFALATLVFVVVLAFGWRRGRMG